MSGLEFVESTHRYKCDGKLIPGVTTILNVVNKSGPLVWWASGLVAEYAVDHLEELSYTERGKMIEQLRRVPNDTKKDAGKRGNILHDHAEAILHGREVEVDAEHVDVMTHALAFMDAWQIEPVLIEQACASRTHWYAGTLDLVADYRNPVSGETGRAIFDWKSGKRVYASAVFQVNAYGHSDFYGLDGDERSTAELGIAGAFGVHIRPDGYSVHPLPYGPQIFDEFLAIKRVWEINKRAEGNFRKPGSGYVGAALEAAHV